MNEKIKNSRRKKTIESGARILRVLKMLKGHTLTGLSNTELAKALGDSPCNVNRALNTLIAEGLAVKLDNGRFAHSVGMLQIAQAHADHVTKLQGRILELNQRIAAGASY
ncbi:helix-turn-helix domain-containing protein [Methylococcus mesophilus]|uniref:helix-turn-helix domain-containing protein n=1 Tax=Methylococcus mesophilus TaxID=2993564 RepID=UPI00224A5E67|nr:helix-turn-helix domain-containing protein [Methylococcus mesophilus]UZR27461.1 helix-turn-helix domain-containing protein [Methylococcus mesophilus]